MDSSSNEKHINLLPVTGSNQSFIVKSIWEKEKIAVQLVDLSEDSANEWKGEIPMDEVRAAALELEISFDEFLNEYKKATITNGGIPSFQYDLENQTFVWRKITQFKIMYLSINLVPCDGLKNELLLDCVNRIHSMKTDIDSLKSEIDLHEIEHKEFVERYEKYVNAKNNIEKDILTKVAAVLNSKKDKIAELQNLLFEKTNELERRNLAEETNEYNTSDEETIANRRATASQPAPALPKRKKMSEGRAQHANRPPSIRPPRLEDSDSSNSDEDIFNEM